MRFLSIVLLLVLCRCAQNFDTELHPVYQSQNKYGEGGVLLHWDFDSCSRGYISLYDSVEVYDRIQLQLLNNDSIIEANRSIYYEYRYGSNKQILDSTQRYSYSVALNKCDSTVTRNDSIKFIFTEGNRLIKETKVFLQWEERTWLDRSGIPLPKLH